MFTTIFSIINDVNDLKKVANTIREQLVSAYNTRAKELGAVEASAPAPTTTSATKPIAKDMAAKAKEAAAKMKQTEKKESKETKKTAKVAKDEPVQVAITDKAAIKKLNLVFEPYSDKSWVLHGDTKQIKDALGEIKGIRYNPSLTLDGGETRFGGWVCRTENAQRIADTLGLKVKVA